MTLQAADRKRALSPAELEEALRKIGRQRYHDLHPFHKLLHGGDCDMGQVQAWVLNRYYYQCSIPLKDAALMSRTHDPAIRREPATELIIPTASLIWSFGKSHHSGSSNGAPLSNATFVSLLKKISRT